MAQLFKQSKDKIEVDVDKFIDWAKKRNNDISSGKIDITLTEMPTLAKVICGGENWVSKLNTEEKKEYQKYFEKNKKNKASLTLIPVAEGNIINGANIASIASGVGVASALTGVVGISGTAAGIAGVSAISGAASIASLGATAFIPALWPVGVSMLAVGAGSIFKNANKKRKHEEKSGSLQKIFETAHSKAKSCSDKLSENEKIINDTLSVKLKTALEKLQKGVEKAKIQIDDALNFDQNKRIMQYQEIVLNQYNSQNEIRKTLAELLDAYNKLKKENEELKAKIAAYESLMKMTACANNYNE